MPGACGRARHNAIDCFSSTQEDTGKASGTPIATSVEAAHWLTALLLRVFPRFSAALLPSSPAAIRGTIRICLVSGGGTGTPHRGHVGKARR